MIRKFKEEDTTRVMALWTKGNFEAHDFIDKDYWLLNYNEVKEKFSTYKKCSYISII